jgi:serine/threonine protein kinase
VSFTCSASTPASNALIAEKIGSGSYGVVYKVVRKVDKMIYAMKEIDLQGMSRKVRIVSTADLHASITILKLIMIVTIYAGTRRVH